MKYLITPLLLFFSITLNAQTFKITGVVSDSNGPIFGAMLQVVGNTSSKAKTDIDGKFSIMVKANDVVKVSSIGLSDYAFTIDPKKKHYIINMKPRVDYIVIEEEVEEVEEDNRVSAGMKVTIKETNRRKNKKNKRTSSTPSYEPISNNEDYGIIKENNFLSVSDKPMSTFSVDVDRASYSNIRRFVNSGSLPPKDAVRIEEMINYFSYNYPQPKGVHPIIINTEVSSCPWNENSQLALVNLNAKKIKMDNLPPSNLVFLLDVSGSMAYENKLSLVKSSIKLLTKQLRKQDKVSIVVYAGAAGVVLKPTSGDKKQAIYDALDELKAGGSTAGGQGIQLAYKLAQENFIKNGNNRVILATDGDFNVGASSDDDMIRLIEEKRKSGVFITALGFGMGNYKDSKMEQIADKGNGNYAYIDSQKEANKVFVKEFGGTLFTVAKDVKLQVEFNPNQVAAYRLIGYENRLLNDEDFKDDKVDAGEMGAGHTVTALYEIIPVGAKNKYLPKALKLRYQKSNISKKRATKTDELMYVKVRYKTPKGTKSTKFTKVINGSASTPKASENLRWAASVAELGMILRESKLKGTSTLDQVLKNAKKAMSSDKNKYRQEFVDMVKKIKKLKKNVK